MNYPHSSNCRNFGRLILLLVGTGMVALPLPAATPVGTTNPAFQARLRELTPSELAQMTMAVDPCAGAIPPAPAIGVLQPAMPGARSGMIANRQQLLQSFIAQEYGSDPMPDIIDWQPRSSIPAGRELRVQGRNLDPSRFVLKIGDTVIGAATQAASEMRYTIPTTLRSFGAPLVVYHRGGAPRTLASSFEVFDPSPRIMRVAPETFSQGDTVTLCGVSVSHLTLPTSVLTSTTNGVRQYAMRNLALIGQPNGQYQNYHYLEMLNPAGSASGDRLVFVAGNLFREQFRENNASNSAVYTDTVADFQPPASVTGPLSFHSETNPTTSRDVVAPNNVTLSLGGPRILKLGVNPRASGFGLGESFVIQAPTLPNSTNFNRLVQLSLEGYMLDGQYKIGNVELAASFSGGGLPADETRGLLSVPLTASSGAVCGTRNAITVCWPQSITVIPGPVLASLPATPLALRVTHTINGLHLLPAGMPGLTYEFSINGLTNSSEQIAGGSAPTIGQCNMALQVLEHTDSRIRFRIGDPAGPAPNTNCLVFLAHMFDAASPNRPHLWLTAKYAGKRSDLWYQQVHLAP